MSSEKRRLRILSDDEKKLMTEVLPDPTQGADPGSVRQRTVQRMTRLLAIAAASATIQAKCGGGQDATTGYAVVDPMPMPACPDVASTIHATATWRKVGYGFGIEIKLSKPGRADAHYRDPGRPSVAEASITSAVVKDGEMTIVLLPALAKQLHVYVEVDCPGGSSRVVVFLKPGEHKEGATLPVQLSDAGRGGY